MIFEHRLEEGGQAMQIFRVKSSEIEATGFAKALGENELGMFKEEQNTQGRNEAIKKRKKKHELSKFI